ncbi:unnamed protein product [Caenorhabditis auriculariae]|uniref:G protein-coupled receptor n=1 Tax=Caenorhabditis auriculariae TaxID=2777116 RepID=A0A8S1HH39_9PELO|nr:unnamed protein product [Caenorhabditis auriculariae]
MVNGVANIYTFGAQFTIMHASLPIFPIYAVILILRKKIIKNLGVINTSMRSDTKAMHKQFLKALTYQACIPAFFSVAVVSYSLGQLNIINHPILEHTTVTALIFIPVLTPLASLIFVRPYRDKMGSMLNISANSVSRNATVSVSGAL